MIGQMKTNEKASAWSGSCGKAVSSEWRRCSFNFSCRRNVVIDYLEAMNDQVWAGHSRMLEDATHALGGIGIGLVACSAFDGSTRNAGYALMALSGALHLYALLTARPRRPRSALSALFGGG